MSVHVRSCASVCACFSVSACVPLSLLLVSVLSPLPFEYTVCVHDAHTLHVYDSERTTTSMCVSLSLWAGPRYDLLGQFKPLSAAIDRTDAYTGR